MKESTYRLEFAPEISLDEVVLTFGLATYSAEGIHGAARVRLEAKYHRDDEGHALVMNAQTPVGLTVVRILTALLTREFGEDSFRVRLQEPAETGAVAVST